ncbi:MAG: hypothetical protein M3290_07020 [Actinomycetota bacterium]|nr:hypothetical protein [Actinomycetota bacterium]
MSPAAAAVIVAISLALILVMAGNSRDGFQAVRSIALVAVVVIALAAVIGILIHR